MGGRGDGLEANVKFEIKKKAETESTLKVSWTRLTVDNVHVSNT